MPNNPKLSPLRRCELEMALAVLRGIEGGLAMSVPTVPTMDDHDTILIDRNSELPIPIVVPWNVQRFIEGEFEPPWSICGSPSRQIKSGPWLADAILKVEGELKG